LQPLETLQTISIITVERTIISIIPDENRLQGDSGVPKLMSKVLFVSSLGTQNTPFNIKTKHFSLKYYIN
jgi:hypothetical protein